MARAGTAHQASLDNAEVAGKTGTAQWGPKNKRSARRHGSPGFLPADQPRYAFATITRGDVGSKVHGGSAAAPMIADIFKEIYRVKSCSTGRPAGSVAVANSQKFERAEPGGEEDGIRLTVVNFSISRGQRPRLPTMRPPFFGAPLWRVVILSGAKDLPQGEWSHSWLRLVSSMEVSLSFGMNRTCRRGRRRRLFVDEPRSNAPRLHYAAQFPLVAPLFP